MTTFTKPVIHLLMTGLLLLMSGQLLAGPKPPPAVTVSEVIIEPVIKWGYFTGQLASPDTVELRPRVSGFINAVQFTEGSFVKKGDVLFVIDPRQFKAEVNRLTAELNSEKANQRFTINDLKRAESLKKRHAISSEQVDSRLKAQQQAKAKVAAMQAKLDSAKLDLDFTQVRAPISGKISTANITAGNLVNKGQTLLTTIVSMDKMYAYFVADEHSYLDYQKAHRNDAVQANHTKTAPLALLGLANETGFVHQGTVDFIDNQVDSSTGTIRGRALFDNADQVFTPGLFARMKMALSPASNTVLIDDKALATDLSNKYVLVVSKENKLSYRSVVPGVLVHGLRAIKSGLKAGEKIVTSGLQRVRPGVSVTPEIKPMADPKIVEAIRKETALNIQQSTSVKR